MAPKAKKTKRTKQEQAVRPATRQELLQIVAMLDREHCHDRRGPRQREYDKAEEELERFEKSCERLVELRKARDTLREKSSRAWQSRSLEIGDLRKLILLEGATPRVLARVSKLLPRP